MPSRNARNKDKTRGKRLPGTRATSCNWVDGRRKASAPGTSIQRVLFSCIPVPERPLGGTNLSFTSTTPCKPGCSFAESLFTWPRPCVCSVTSLFISDPKLVGVSVRCSCHQHKNGPADPAQCSQMSTERLFRYDCPLDRKFYSTFFPST